ncbi:uncharacterized protein LOC133171536 isoform X2 [Saccostrea echinata]|uniref:uncharacterized protein LOC133171536 isoform X2 n=1 Tax=Saccostrea echinata TaxID=191078 RepID=UPI002A807229|nr:uncharacterized protein LOC133171536 isoform X2 [Saccostrea echinata]
MSFNSLTSPKPKRRKNKAKLKLSWDAPTKEELIAEQIDNFISDVIKNAKQEYLAQERENSLNEYGMNLNKELKEEMIELNTREINGSQENIHGNNTDNQTSEMHARKDRGRHDNNYPARNCTHRPSELNEGNPLLADSANMPKRRYLRLLQRHILRMCCHCSCIMNGNDVT